VFELEEWQLFVGPFWSVLAGEGAFFGTGQHTSVLHSCSHGSIQSRDENTCCKHTTFKHVMNSVQCTGEIRIEACMFATETLAVSTQQSSMS